MAWEEGYIELPATSDNIDLVKGSYGKDLKTDHEEASFNFERLP